MEFSRTALIGLEAAINRVIETDPVTRQRFAQLHGQRIAIELKGWLTLHFVADESGRVQLFLAPVEEADAAISATPFDFAGSLVADRQSDQVFKGKIRLLGNTQLAEQFAAILNGFEFDWEEQLSKVAGDLVAHQLGNNFRGVFKWAYRSRKHLGGSFGEYVTEEKQLLPTRFEFDEWREQVEETRDAVERLEARLRLIDASLASASEKKT